MMISPSGRPISRHSVHLFLHFRRRFFPARQRNDRDGRFHKRDCGDIAKATIALNPCTFSKVPAHATNFLHNRR